MTPTLATCQQARWRFYSPALTRHNPLQRRMNGTCASAMEIFGILKALPST